MMKCTTRNASRRMLMAFISSTSSLTVAKCSANVARVAKVASVFAEKVGEGWRRLTVRLASDVSRKRTYSSYLTLHSYACMQSNFKFLLLTYTDLIE